MRGPDYPGSGSSRRLPRQAHRLHLHFRAQYRAEEPRRDRRHEVAQRLEIMKKKKGNTKVETDDFNFYLFELINNAKNNEDILQKNIVLLLVKKTDIQKSNVYKRIKNLREQGLINLNKAGELSIN